MRAQKREVEGLTEGEGRGGRTGERQCKKEGKIMMDGQKVVKWRGGLGGDG